ncbi:hypothetical protein [Azospirillum thermophilum]|uniref:hypothetical protein n=1 Tax=Azospirillum thermophilum TaxID=2202148 RepID=UPI00143CDB9B|nr:hypothetical protein [Azospirillum thermophilum]
MVRKKMSGAALLAELGEGALDRSAPIAAPSGPAPVPASTSRVGRRSKVGTTFVPLTVRVSAEQDAALKRAAFELMASRGPGANITPQDVIRILIDRAIADPDFPASLIQEVPL